MNLFKLFKNKYKNYKYNKLFDRKPKSRFKIIYDKDLIRIIEDTETGYQYLAYSTGVGTGLTRLLNKWGV